MPSTAKQRTCKECKRKYTPWSSQSPLERFCGHECATRWGYRKALEKRAKAARARTREQRESLKTLGDWTKEAQVEFNAYIRERDMGHCISCGATPDPRFGGGVDAGHYRSRGAAPHLRFHTLNVWAQCKKCNRELSGNVVEMRKGLVRLLGEKRVTELEHDNRSRQYTKEDLKRIKLIFRKRRKLYQRLRGTP